MFWILFQPWWMLDQRVKEGQEWEGGRTNYTGRQEKKIVEVSARKLGDHLHQSRLGGNNQWTRCHSISLNEVMRNKGGHVLLNLLVINLQSFATFFYFWFLGMQTCSEALPRAESCPPMCLPNQISSLR